MPPTPGVSGVSKAQVEPSAPDPPARTLGEQTVSGVRSMGLTRVVAESAGLISSIVLARLVSPAEFGRTAAAVFVAGLALAIPQAGRRLVPRRAAGADARSHFQAAAFTALAAGAVGTVLTLLFALTLAPRIFGDRIAFFAVLASPTWLLASVTAVPIAQLQRQLGFARLGIIQASASVIGPAVAIVLALAGLDGEAIVIGAVVAVAVTAVLGVRPLSPAEAGVASRAEAREIVNFGAPTSASSILSTAIRNVDNVLLAAFVPAFQVGLYMRAFTLGSDYQSKISQILLSVAFPVLSRARTVTSCDWVRARMIRVHTTILFPLLFGLIAVRCCSSCHGCTA